MSQPTLTCPFCNAHLPESGEALDCPRCGERLAASTGTAIAAPAAGPTVPPADEAPVRWGRWLAVLSVLAILAALGAWIWQRSSGGRLPSEAGGPDNPAPAQLAALGFLPDDTNVMVGIHVRALLDHPRGWETLAAFGINVEADKDKPSLERLIGLAPAEVDHAVLGLQLEGGAARMILVLNAREPFSEEQIAKRLGAGRPSEVNGRKLYPVPVQLPRIGAQPGSLWCATDRTLVIALKSEDLAAVPATPNPDIDRFRGPLPALLRDKLPAGTVAWVAAHADQWSRTALPALLFILPIDTETRRAWEGLRSLAAGARLDPEPRLALTALCDDDAGAGRLETYLGRTAAKQIPSFRQSRGGREVAAEVSISADSLRPLLQQFGLRKER